VSTPDDHIDLHQHRGRHREVVDLRAQILDQRARAGRGEIGCARSLLQAVEGHSRQIRQRQEMSLLVGGGGTSMVADKNQKMEASKLKPAAPAVSANVTVGMPQSSHFIFLLFASRFCSPDRPRGAPSVPRRRRARAASSPEGAGA
jgi:hypothetical protein